MPPVKGFPLEFGIDARGPECFYDVATRRSKKFQDRFSRFDTIPAVTDSHPDRHVAVASTRYAIASRLKSRIIICIYMCSFVINCPMMSIIESLQE